MALEALPDLRSGAVQQDPLVRRGDAEHVADLLGRPELHVTIGDDQTLQQRELIDSVAHDADRLLLDDAVL